MEVSGKCAVNCENSARWRVMTKNTCVHRWKENQRLKIFGGYAIFQIDSPKLKCCSRSSYASWAILWHNLIFDGHSNHRPPHP